ncbi:MAG: T9SS type A sorting domain-containing protein [Chitinophagaceae bacterium]|nr:T9SS type A sorting domain-containing protein [Chitinophagaceae bacterium]
MPKNNDGTVAAYNFSDDAPLKGHNFYRVKVVEHLGSIVYGVIAHIRNDKQIESLIIYPSPVTGSLLNFKAAGLVKGKYYIKIINSIGQQVYTQEQLLDGSTMNQKIQLPHLKRGVYTFIVTGNGVPLRKSFVAE